MSTFDQTQNAETIYPTPRHPYYIVAPPYTRKSAGTCVQHLLCHSLNRRGQTAYILLHPRLPWQTETTAPDLLTPLVTPQIVRSHFERGLTPIMIYPEVIAGNPLKGPCVVRNVMNFPGLLGGDADYAPDELCFSYSKILAEKTREPENILYVPVIDTRIFHPASENQPRRGSCFYAHKYQTAHKGKLQPVTQNSIEIKRDGPGAQTPQQIADLFRRSELFYCYENTALATEAILCGCPAVMLPNPYFTEMIALEELGREGFAWGTDPSEIAHAKATVTQGAQNYLNTYAIYWRELENFILKTQKHAEGKNYTHPIRLPSYKDILNFGLRSGLWQGLNKLGRQLGVQ